MQQTVRKLKLLPTHKLDVVVDVNFSE